MTAEQILGLIAAGIILLALLLDEVARRARKNAQRRAQQRSRERAWRDWPTLDDVADPMEGRRLLELAGLGTGVKTW